jgi:hypothetical protein
MSTPLPNTRKQPINKYDQQSQSIMKNSVPASMSTIPEVKDDDLKSWMDSVYSNINMSIEELNKIYEQVSYKGFNRNDVLKQLKVLFPEPKFVTEVILVVTLRGPQQASIVKLSNGRSLLEMGVPASGGQGTKRLTCNKIAAATADYAAALMKKIGVPKRLNLTCPAWLQFPAAGSIKLPAELREMHREFSKQFSVVIGGQYNESIYNQMEFNAYLEPKLNLFQG